MVAEIKAAAKVGDSLGGIAEVLAYGVPVGLGSHVHWDRKLDGLLAQALMSIHAIKGVEIGDGFDLARRRGSEAHDAIFWDAAQSYVRETARAGGTEGGIIDRRAVVARAAMKPLATLNRPVLHTVDVDDQRGRISFRERTDVDRRAGDGCRRRDHGRSGARRRGARKFGGDSLAEFLRNHDAYLAALGETPSAALAR